MVLRFLSLACLISVPLLSLSQESGKAKPRVPVTKSPGAVSKAGIIYVVGDVHKPMGVVMKDTGPITVLKALATAEGANPTASLHNAKILRKGENGPTEVPADIKEILSGKAPDVTLQADDILFVPRSAGKSARKPQNEHFYDVPPSGPLQGPTPIYTR
jgi:protein involved in polysaccharide export with SLBB domain